MRSVFFVSICTLLLFSCKEENECENVLPPPNYFELGFADANGNALIGTLYPQDSFKLYSANEVLYLKTTPFGNGQYLQFRYPEIGSGITYFLDVDATDTDTIVINYNFENEPCFTSYTLNSIVYNGTVLPITGTSGPFTIEK